MSQLSTAEGMAILRGAFQPLLCTVYDLGPHKGVGFNVLAPDGSRILSVPDVPTYMLQNPIILESFLEQARTQIRAKGYALAVWSFPKRG